MIEIFNKTFFHTSFKKYLIVGLLNTSITISIIFLLKWTLNLNDIFANAMGYGSGLIFSFFANKKWTFNFIGEKQYIFIKFIIVFFIAYLCNLAVVVISMNYVNSYISHTLGVPAYTIIGYLGNRFFTFKSIK